MDWLTQILNWFAGGEYGYMRLYQCMKRDWLWIGITVALDFSVAAGYMVIALHWWRNQKRLPDVPAKRALGNMRNIFLFCGICGYAFIPIKMIWPAWRLYDLFMAVLVYYTWRYAWSARDLKVIYSELGRSSQLAEDLEKSRAETRQRDFFLNALSHDLRTPLNSLTLQAKIAEMNLKDGELDELRETLSDIRESTRATCQMFESLLDYAALEKNGKNKLETIQLADLFSRIASRCRAIAQSKELYLKVAATDVSFVTDPIKLERVLVNLTDNAIKFTRDGGVRIEVDRGAGGVEIHVIDTGEGIDSVSQSRLFQEFFQVNNPARDREKGFGLGLAIARRLTRQLGGDIHLESAPGRGSRFSVILPTIAHNGDGRAETPIPAHVIIGATATA